MKFGNNLTTIQKANWLKITIFYISILLLTYISRRLPNLFQLLYSPLTDTYLPWNFNHGITIIIVSFLFYKLTSQQPGFTLLGTNKLKSIAFPCILFIGYGLYGIKNDQGINEHLWALTFCFFTLVYDLMEEYVWRGYLIENLGKTTVLLKSLVSGVCWGIWHLLIFKEFSQYGGFGAFLAFCIIFSLVLTFSITTTKSLLVPATIHALLIRTNIITLTCFIIYLVLLFTWNRLPRKAPSARTS